MSIFEGAGVALITPFTETGEIDYKRLGELLEFQIAGHTDAIIVCGCTGEAAALTPEERRSCIRYTVETVAHRIPVIAGAGTNITKTAIEWSRDAVECGADAILSITPYYNKGTQKGLIAHYKAIAESVPVPVMLYNVPSRTEYRRYQRSQRRYLPDCRSGRARRRMPGYLLRQRRYDRPAFVPGREGCRFRSL